MSQEDILKYPPPLLLPLEGALKFAYMTGLYLLKFESTSFGFDIQSMYISIYESHFCQRNPNKIKM